MNGFVWNVDPDIFVIGPIHLRYYGILLGTTLVVGYYFFQKQMKKYGYSEEVSLDENKRDRSNLFFFTGKIEQIV